MPLGLSALLALVFFPVMCGKGEGAYTRVSGAEWEGYAERWLLVSALLFAGSGVLLRGAVEDLKDAIRPPADVDAPGALVDRDRVRPARRRRGARAA